MMGGDGSKPGGCPTDAALSDFVDGEAGAGAAAIEAHLERCGACRAEVAALTRVNDLVLMREAEARAAPRPVAARAPPRLSRRWMLGAGGVAAAAALTVAVVPWARRAPLALAPTLFEDFSTRLAADRSLDIYSDDGAALLAWFDARLPFVAPRLAFAAEVEVRGGRLCWLLGRRFAALHLVFAGEEGCLYLAEPDGLTVARGAPLPPSGAAPAAAGQAGVSGLFWRQQTLAFSLIGPQTTETMNIVAQGLTRKA